MKLRNYTLETVRDRIDICQLNDHVQQVAFSTYHGALTQICFTCKMIRTSMNKDDYVKKQEGVKDGN